MLTAVVLALRASAGLAGAAPGDLTEADERRWWRPGPAVVRYLEAHVAVPARMGGPVSNFDRYYVGVIRDGRRVVFVTYENLSVRPPGSGAAHVVRPSHAPHIADGGCGVLRMLYDPATRTASALECDADLSPPPPQAER